MGNGKNDALMVSCAALGFAILQEEGTSTKTLMASDVVFKSINDALDALIYPKRLVATLRN
jgi:soluble P-type ATPase